MTPLGFSLVGVPRLAGRGVLGTAWTRVICREGQAERPGNLTLACQPQSAEPLILHQRNSLKSLSSDFFFSYPKNKIKKKNFKGEVTHWLLCVICDPRGKLAPQLPGEITRLQPPRKRKPDTHVHRAGGRGLRSWGDTARERGSAGSGDLAAGRPECGLSRTQSPRGSSRLQGPKYCLP